MSNHGHSHARHAMRFARAALVGALAPTAARRGGRLNAAAPRLGSVVASGRRGRARKAEVRRLQVGVLGCLCGVGGVTYMAGSRLQIGQQDAERVWLGERGPLSRDRAVAVLPTGLCISAGAVAAFVAAWFPRQTRHVAITSRAHEFLSLPLAILMAFRFQNAYERWWSCRNASEDVASELVGLASFAAGASTVPSSKTAHMATGTAPPTAVNGAEVALIRARFFALLDAYAVLAERMIHGADFEPHERNETPWPSFEELLSAWPADAAAAAAHPDQTAWCVAAMATCIDELQKQDAISGDRAGVMYEMLRSLEQSLGSCMVVVRQQSPAPFVVHLRTLLLFFCASFPFVIIQHERPLVLVFAQSMLSFAFLGSEFCSREMEHPFGDDAADIPLRRILAGARARVAELREPGVLAHCSAALP